MLKLLMFLTIPKFRPTNLVGLGQPFVIVRCAKQSRSFHFNPRLRSSARNDDFLSKHASKILAAFGIPLILFFMLPNPLWAMDKNDKNPLTSTEQSQLPVNIESDTAEFDATKGSATHRGHVSVKQGDRFLSSDSLEIKRNSEGKLQMISAEGNPASFEANPDPLKPKIYGKARILHYFPKENKIILMDNAELKQVDKTLQGARVTYHFDNQTLVSDSKENQRTTLIIKQGD